MAGAQGVRRRNRIARKETEKALVFRATLPMEEEKKRTPPGSAADATPTVSASPLAPSIRRAKAASPDHRTVEVHRSLRNLHLLLRSERLYEKNHPQKLDSLDSAYDSLRKMTELHGGLEIRVERGGLVVPRVSDAHLPDARGEMQALAADLQRAGVHALVFSKKFHVGELDTLAQLMKASL